MTAKQLRDLFFQTGLPEAYILARRKERQEKEGGDHHAVHHPGDRPAGGQL